MVDEIWQNIEALSLAVTQIPKELHVITRATLTPKYPRLPTSIYVQHVETVKQLGPWNSLCIWAHAEDGGCETVRHRKQSKYSCLFGGYRVVMYFQLGKTWKFDFISHIWPWRSRSVVPQNNRDLNQGIQFCTSGPNSGFPQKSQKKVPWFFHDFSRPKSNFPDKKKSQYFFFAAHVSNCRQTDRRTLTHRHTHD